MEYDKSTMQAPPIPDGAEHQENSPSSGHGHLRIVSDIVDTKVIQQPLTFPFSGRTAKNRLLKAPMTERLCAWNKENEDIHGFLFVLRVQSARGFPTPEYLNIYKRWGEGEIGIIVFGNTMVQYDAVEAFGNPILVDDHDGRVAKYREVVEASKAHGSLAICQLSHPGRQGNKALNPHPVSASDVHLKIAWAGNEFAKPRPMTRDEVKGMVQRWGETAYLCKEAGFDGVQIHCAHGYLLAQFISPSTNLRTDEYGGDLTNRTRIVFEVISEIQRRVPDPGFIICVKLNSVEFQDKGITTDDFKQFCVRLEQARVDFLDLSGGTFEARAFEHKKESTKKRESYFIEFAETIRPLVTKSKIYVTGGLRTAGGMVRAVESNACDGVGMARPLTAEPYLCKEILSGRVTGSIDNFVPLPQNTQACGTQIHQLGAGDEQISDFSVHDEVERWKAANEKETQRKISILPKVDSSGYPPLKATAGFAYLR